MTQLRSVAVVLVAASCAGAPATDAACILEKSDQYGPPGKVPVKAEVVASGLDVPWGLVWLPNGDLLVTERPGRLRLLSKGQLSTVATVPVSRTSEDGLLGLALAPDDPLSVYLYTTQDTGNRVERWKLSADHRSAQLEKVIFAGIAKAQFHDGGRIRFGPDGMLYVGTGDARQPDRAQDLQSPNGKLLRLTPDGSVPKDNPVKGSPVFLSGIRNLQGFDWLDDSTLVLADHGPSGELGRSGHDEVNVAKAGDNLGWPTIYSCEKHEGMVTPLLTWEQAVPPGGLAIYRGSSIPEWKGSVLVASLRSEHLHRVVLGNGQVKLHETYFLGQLGRLREAIMGPDGELYVTTSNCDGRGECGADKDRILRITRR